MSADVFYRLLDCLLARPIAPWDVWSFAPRLHPVLFVHRVEGLEPGLLCAAAPSRMACRRLRAALAPGFRMADAGRRARLIFPSSSLLPADCRAVAKTVSCHQAIASDGCFSLSMLSEFEPVVSGRSLALPPASLGSGTARACPLPGSRSRRAARHRDRLLFRRRPA